MIKQIKSLIQFHRGTKTVLDALTQPIPDGILIYCNDSGDFKLGNGIDSYSDLEVLFTYNYLLSFMVDNTINLNLIFDNLTVIDEGKIVVVKENNGNYIYGVSDVLLSDLVSDMMMITTLDAEQSTIINNYNTLLSQISDSINSNNNGNIIIINDGKYTNSGITIPQLTSQLSTNSSSKSHLKDPKFYNDSELTSEIDKHYLEDNFTYYIKLDAFNNDKSFEFVFDVTTKNNNIIITKIVDNVFSITFDGICSEIDNIPFILKISVNSSEDNYVYKIISCQVWKCVNIFMLFNYNVYSYGIIIHNNKIYCFGIPSENSGFVIIVFDMFFNIISSKRYTSPISDSDYFYFKEPVIIDEYIYVIGNMRANGIYYPLLLKIDLSLNIINKLTILVNNLTNTSISIDVLKSDNDYFYLYMLYNNYWVVVKISHNFNNISYKFCNSNYFELISEINSLLLFNYNNYNYFINKNDLNINIVYELSVSEEITYINNIEYYNGFYYLLSSFNSDYSCAIIKTDSNFNIIKTKLFYNQNINFFYSCELKLFIDDDMIYITTLDNYTNSNGTTIINHYISLIMLIDIDLNIKAVKNFHANDVFAISDGYCAINDNILFIHGDVINDINGTIDNIVLKLDICKINNSAVIDDVHNISIVDILSEFTITEPVVTLNVIEDNSLFRSDITDTISLSSIDIDTHDYIVPKIEKSIIEL